MPFLKLIQHSIPRSRCQELLTLKSGLRHAIFSIPGDIYIGEWQVDKKEGKGALHTRSGKLYEGDWQRGLRHGFGIQSTEQPNKSFDSDYIGHWMNGKREGDGMCFYKDGSCYEGKWKSGKRWGYGRNWYADGSYYEGYWASDKLQGLGIFVQPNGNRYEGEWCCGIKSGRGIFYHLDSGQKQEGIWENGIATCSTLKDIFYRQSGRPPTEYSVPPVQLHDANGVYANAENGAVNRLQYDNLTTSQFESGIRELRNLVWGSQVVDW